MQKRTGNDNNFNNKRAWGVAVLLLLILNILAFQAKPSQPDIPHLMELSVGAKADLCEIDSFDQNMLWYLCMVACLEYCKMKKEQFPRY